MCWAITVTLTALLAACGDGNPTFDAVEQAQWADDRALCDRRLVTFAERKIRLHYPDGSFHF